MSARWNLVVSEETDRHLRRVLAEQGRARKGEISRYVEEAVRDRIFDDQVAAMHEKTAHLSETEIAELVDEAVAWARRGGG